MKTEYKRVVDQDTFMPMLEVKYYIPFQLSVNGRKDDPEIFEKIGKEIMDGAAQYLKDTDTHSIYGQWSVDEYNFKSAK